VKRLSAWGPVVAWCALIFWFSSIPDLKSPLTYDYPLRKLAHLAEYAVLWAFLHRALLSECLAARPAGAVAFLMTVLYAVSDEVHQSFVPGRAGAASDVLIDAAGAVLSWARSRGQSKAPH
jgi:VanZ family protein